MNMTKGSVHHSKDFISLSEEQRLAWLQLIRSNNVGPMTFRNLINHFGSAQDALLAIPELAARGGSKKQIKLCSHEDALREIKAIEAKNGALIALGEPAYPPLLKQIDAPPPLITVYGNLKIMQLPSISIVGARNASISGQKLTHKFAQDLSRQGWLITSGLARGIDTAAHIGADNRQTAAVLAGGLDHIYPAENKELLESIINENGAALTEMPYHWKPRAKDFPRRNRLVAGLSFGILVVEAAKRSGSLITARLAGEYGRQLFAIPGAPSDPRAEGTNHLIRNGAILTRHADDIIEVIRPMLELKLPITEMDESIVQLELDEPTNNERTSILNLLSSSPITVDEIIRFTGLDAAKVHMAILEFELAQRIERHPGQKITILR